MELNSITHADGAKHAKRRVGRGIGSGLGKTAGRGHKGQKSRAGGYHKVGFEGGQMEQLGADEVNVLTLKAAGLVNQISKVVKVISSGALTKAVKLNGIGATAGAKAAIEAVGGSVA